MGEISEHGTEAVDRRMLEAFGPLSSLFASIVDNALIPYKQELASLRKQVESIDIKPDLDLLKIPSGCLSWEQAKTKRFLSIKQTAYVLGMSDKSVRRKIEGGIIKASKGLRHVRIPIEEIEAYRQRTV